MARPALPRCDRACFSAALIWPTVRAPGGSVERLEDGVVAEAAVAARREWRCGPRRCRARKTGVAAVHRGGSRKASTHRSAPRAAPGAGPRAPRAAWRCSARRSRRARRSVACRRPAAAQRVDLEPGVVGQRGQPGPLGVEAGLDARRCPRRCRRPRSARPRCPRRRASRSSTSGRWSSARSSRELVAGAGGEQQPPPARSGVGRSPTLAGRSADARRCDRATRSSPAAMRCRPSASSAVHLGAVEGLALRGALDLDVGARRPCRPR